VVSCQTRVYRALITKGLFPNCQTLRCLHAPGSGADSVDRHCSHHFLGSAQLGWSAMTRIGSIHSIEARQNDDASHNPVWQVFPTKVECEDPVRGLGQPCGARVVAKIDHRVNDCPSGHPPLRRCRRSCAVSQLDLPRGILDGLEDNIGREVHLWPPPLSGKSTTLGWPLSES
jgi:hypothetical protein